MKLKLISTLLTLLVCVVAQAQTPSAEEVMNKAFQKASKEKKNVLLIYHASWCGWCKRMDKAIEDVACKDFFEKNYEVVHLTVQESANNKHLENAGADALMIKHFGKNQGLPYWVILDASGKLLEDAKMRGEGEPISEKGTNTGCPAAPEEVEAFVQKLKRTSKYTDEEIEAVKNRFLKNK